MTQKERQESLETEKIYLSGLRKFTHFELSFYLTIISGIFVLFYFLGKNGIIGHGKMEPLTLLLLAGIPFTIAVLFYLRQHSQLKYHVINLKCSEGAIVEAYKRTQAELAWTEKKSGTNFFISQTNPGLLSFNWGEEITIIWNSEKVIINSICDPSSKAAIFSMGRNKQNVVTFEKNLRVENENTT